MIYIYRDIHTSKFKQDFLGVTQFPLHKHNIQIMNRYHLVSTSNVLKVSDKDLEKLQRVRPSGRWSSAPDLQALARISEATNSFL